ncbi:MAG: toll/interleukin-1 receptor domain-containing protein, partial [Vicinamibacteria bacterium]
MPRKRPRGMVFVSYAHADKDRVEPLVSFLARRFNVWWDRGIETGEVWRRAIADRLDEARCVVVVWTAASVKRTFIWSEVERVKDRGVLVPVKMDARARIPLDFDQYQHFNLTSWKGAKTAGIGALV